METQTAQASAQGLILGQNTRRLKHVHMCACVCVCARVCVCVSVFDRERERDTERERERESVLVYASACAHTVHGTQCNDLQSVNCTTVCMYIRSCRCYIYKHIHCTIYMQTCLHTRLYMLCGRISCTCAYLPS